MFITFICRPDILDLWRRNGRSVRRNSHPVLNEGIPEERLSIRDEKILRRSPCTVRSDTSRTIYSYCDCMLSCE